MVKLLDVPTSPALLWAIVATAGTGCRAARDYEASEGYTLRIESAPSCLSCSVVFDTVATLEGAYHDRVRSWLAVPGPPPAVTHGISEERDLSQPEARSVWRALGD
ncbi:MAG: hypothetical protein KatS3mg081_0860 [Gemmatimonadales bacterium]|nr:MAG: hypothetical protein KatS3mg081_0860 [Gemmatimonadales bacterium]